MTTEIVKLPEGQTIGVMAKYCADARLFGDYNQSQIATLMLMAQAEGKHPMMAMQEYDIIKGKPALKSSAVFGRFRKAGGKLQWVKTDETEATCHAEIDGSSIDITWTIDKAKKIGLYRTGSGWEKYPAAMLRARAQVEAIRALAPEVLSGLYCSEEVRQFDDKEEEPVTAPVEPVKVEKEPVIPEAPITDAEFAEEMNKVPVEEDPKLSDECLKDIAACKTKPYLMTLLNKWLDLGENEELLRAALRKRQEEINEVLKEYAEKSGGLGMFTDNLAQ